MGSPPTLAEVFLEQAGRGDRVVVAWEDGDSVFLRWKPLTPAVAGAALHPRQECRAAFLIGVLIGARRSVERAHRGD